uniref:Uncharacterized protein n=1 Tax=Rhizophora mucronata TaxID=61149 RepID=A0A2P2QLI7_RHIMU
MCVRQWVSSRLDLSRQLTILFEDI